MKKANHINITFRWDQLSEEAKKDMEDCDLVLMDSDPEEVREEEERIRKDMHRLNRLKRVKDN